jgi:hypothetical protein
MKRRTFFSLLVPPVTLKDVGEGVLHGVQSGRINHSAELDHLRDRVGAPVGATAEWNEAKSEFLDEIRDPILLEQVVTQDVEFERAPDCDPKTVYRSKLRVVFTNETGQAIHVGEPVWDATPEQVAAKPKDFETPVQLEQGRGGWRKGRWVDEKKTPPYPVEIPAGGTFRTWIGLVEDVPGWDLRRRHSKSDVGTLHIPISVPGKRIGEVRRRV